MSQLFHAELFTTSNEKLRVERFGAFLLRLNLSATVLTLYSLTPCIPFRDNNLKQGAWNLEIFSHPTLYFLSHTLHSDPLHNVSWWRPPTGSTKSREIFAPYTTFFKSHSTGWHPTYRLVIVASNSEHEISRYSRILHNMFWSLTPYIPFRDSGLIGS